MDKNTISYWKNHEYKRHSVLEIQEFIGWNKLKDLCESAKEKRNQALPATLFLTGCRVSEGLQLKVSNFDLTDKDFIKCNQVPIVKQKKIYNKFRTFSFPRDEPLFIYLETYLLRLKQYNKKDSLLFPFGRHWAYAMLKDLGKKNGVDIWCHWFRSQRASQIGVEYDFTENELMEWFKVIDPLWARRYCKKGDYGLRKAMIKSKPEQWRD